ncbi:hypothetical protein BpHYR1_002525 [Brachionus plicatilis]|uniref:Uncharacterized protein n=1 Tax=Brachionus plicatilis TaxID=10195 RepID=A0A3M7SQ78_BRAPC|nr:hypothetical protein BpHYR1_002525 [Brachionus plicatilis]
MVPVPSDSIKNFSLIDNDNNRKAWMVFQDNFNIKYSSFKDNQKIVKESLISLIFNSNKYLFINLYYLGIVHKIDYKQKNIYILRQFN